MKRLITFLLLTLSILGKTWEPISMKDYLHTYKGMVGIIQWKNKEQFLKVTVPKWLEKAKAKGRLAQI